MITIKCDMPTTIETNCNTKKQNRPRTRTRCTRKNRIRCQTPYPFTPRNYLHNGRLE